MHAAGKGLIICNNQRGQVTFGYFLVAINEGSTDSLCGVLRFFMMSLLYVRINKDIMLICYYFLITLNVLLNLMCRFAELQFLIELGMIRHFASPAITYFLFQLFI